MSRPAIQTLIFLLLLLLMAGSMGCGAGRHSISLHRNTKVVTSSDAWIYQRPVSFKYIIGIGSARMEEDLYEAQQKAIKNALSDASQQMGLEITSSALSSIRHESSYTNQTYDENISVIAVHSISQYKDVSFAYDGRGFVWAKVLIERPSAQKKNVKDPLEQPSLTGSETTKMSPEHGKRRTFYIVSSVEKSSVYIDDSLIGITPCTLEHLAQDAVIMTISKEGYYSQDYFLPPRTETENRIFCNQIRIPEYGNQKFPFQNIYQSELPSELQQFFSFYETLKKNCRAPSVSADARTLLEKYHSYREKLSQRSYFFISRKIKFSFFDFNETYSAIPVEIKVADGSYRFAMNGFIRCPASESVKLAASKNDMAIILEYKSNIISIENKIKILYQYTNISLSVHGLLFPIESQNKTSAVSANGLHSKDNLTADTLRL